MDWKKHIETNDDILVGKPVIKGTRLSVEHIIKLLASGWTEKEIFENYPGLSKIALQSVFAYIQEILQDGYIYNEPIKSA